MRPSQLKRLLGLQVTHLPWLLALIRMRRPETGQDLGPALECRVQSSKPIFPHGLISVNKYTPLFDRATAMEGCLRALKDWMIDGIDILTLVPAVVMEAALTMAVRLMVP